MVEALEAGLAGRDRVPAQFRLDHRLDEAAQQDDPERGVADLGAERGRRDQLARADDRGRQDHARADPAQGAPERRRRLNAVLGADLVRIAQRLRLLRRARLGFLLRPHVLDPAKRFVALCGISKINDFGRVSNIVRHKSVTIAALKSNF